MVLPKFDIPAPTATDNPTAASLDNSEEGTTTALYRAAIGTVNTDYYLPIFTRFEANKRSGLSWNAAASQYTLSWMIFRRLWGAALVYAAVVTGTMLIALGIDRMLFQFSETIEIGLYVVLVALYFVIPGFYGNVLLHAASRKKMAYALANCKTLPEACAMLSQKASSRKRFIRIVLVNLTLAGTVAGAYWAYRPSDMPPSSHLKSEETRSHAADPAKPLTPTASGVSQAMARLASSQRPEASATATTAIATSAAVPATVVSALDTSLSPPSLPLTKTPPASACIDCQYPRRAPSESLKPLTERPLRTIAEPKFAQTLAKAASIPKVSASAPATTKHFYINVGLFANAENAHNARRKLLMAGLPASTQDLKTRNGKRTRVRVGPFDTWSETDLAVTKIHNMDLEAIPFRR